MPPAAFNATDFRVFDVPGFRDRMEEIRTRIRPKLEALGQRLAGEIEHATGEAIFAHVARHARRTVHPPADTWVAFGPDPRGYKKHPHFRLAVSRHAVRFLFEVGPEHADKARWAAAWRRSAPRLGPVLRRVAGLGWFRDEHDERPAGALGALSVEEIAALADRLARGRDAQLVLGRGVDAAEAARWTDAQYRAAALEAFRALAPLYRLR